MVATTTDPTPDPTNQESDNELAHVYCAICWPNDNRLPVGFVFFCGTPLKNNLGQACDEECKHLTCIVCLTVYDLHHEAEHS